MSIYDILAPFYARFNDEVDYEKMADYADGKMRQYFPGKSLSLLDLGCGSGNVTLPLLNRGYDMIGLDGSEEMLSVARERAGGEQVLWLCQDMRSFELYGTVGAVTCCLDSVNYLLSPEDLSKCFATVHNYLDPDGLFLFDMNTPYKFENTYGNNAYVLEDEIVFDDGEKAAVFCGWQNTYHPESGLCDFDLTLFEELENGDYRRSDEHQIERCYPLETVKQLLANAGFELLGVWGGFDFSDPAPNCERWYIAARAIKK